MSLAVAIHKPLTDFFAELFGYVMAFRQNTASQQPAYEAVRGEVLRLLKLSEAAVPQGVCSAEEYDAARYAVCAWIDESVMASPWTFKSRWRTEMLQRLFYQSMDAGEKFFLRLKNVESHQQSVREVYTLCLALGFKGRYCAPDDVYALDQLKERQLKWLFNSVSDIPSVISLEKHKLFPEAYGTPTSAASPKKRRLSWPWTVTVVGPMLVLVALFVTYCLTLYSIGETIVKGVRL